MQTSDAMSQLFLLMPMLTVKPDRHLDYEAADATLLMQVTEHAEASLKTIHLGLSAVGALLAQLSIGEEDQLLAASAQPLAALGLFIAELGRLADVTHELAMHCRAHTSDYAPDEVEMIEGALP